MVTNTEELFVQGLCMRIFKIPLLLAWDSDKAQVLDGNLAEARQMLMQRSGKKAAQ